jgi:hypothetical protein
MYKKITLMGLRIIILKIRVASLILQMYNKGDAQELEIVK